MVKIIHVKDSKLPPYYNYDFIEIILTTNGELYTKGSNKSKYMPDKNGANLSWNIGSITTSDGINKILDIIANDADKLLKYINIYFNDVSNLDESVLDDTSSKIYYKILKTVEDYNYYNYLKSENILYSIHANSWFTNDECPSFIKNFIDNGYDYDNDFFIIESSQKAYDDRMQEFVEYVDTGYYKYAKSSLQEIYNYYKKDGYESDFWNKFVPEMVRYDDILTVNNHKLYYEIKKSF